MSDEEFWSSEHDPSLVVTWKFKEGLYGNVGEWECRSFEPRPVIIMLTNVYGSYILDSFDTLKLKWYTMYIRTVWEQIEKFEYGLLVVVLRSIYFTRLIWKIYCVCGKNINFQTHLLIINYDGLKLLSFNKIKNPGSHKIKLYISISLMLMSWHLWS